MNPVLKGDDAGVGSSKPKPSLRPKKNFVFIGAPGSGKTTLVNSILGSRVGFTSFETLSAICFTRPTKASVTTEFCISLVGIGENCVLEQKQVLQRVSTISDIRAALSTLFREKGHSSIGAETSSILHPSGLASDLTFTGFNFIQVEGDFERIPYNTTLFDFPGLDERTPAATVHKLNSFLQHHATTTAFVYDSEVWQDTELEAFKHVKSTLLAMDGITQKLVFVNSKISLYGLYHDCGSTVVLGYLEFIVKDRLKKLKWVEEISYLLESKKASFLAVDALALLMDVSGNLNDCMKARAGLLKRFLDEDMRKSFETEFAIETSPQLILPSTDTIQLTRDSNYSPEGSIHSAPPNRPIKPLARSEGMPPSQSRSGPGSAPQLTIPRRTGFLAVREPSDPLSEFRKAFSSPISHRALSRSQSRESSSEQLDMSINA